MIRRVSVQALKSGEITRTDGHVVVVMRFYPRFLKVEMRDEYIRELSPAEELFREFKDLERSSGDHDSAFVKVRYEERFGLSMNGVVELTRLSKMDKDVILVCQCKPAEKCHADLLMLWAREKFGAKTAQLAHDYPIFLERLRAGRV